MLFGLNQQSLLQIDTLMNVPKETYVYKHIANMQHRKRITEKWTVKQLKKRK